MRNASDLPATGPDSELFDLGRILGKGPTLEFAVTMAEEYRRLLNLLENPDLAAPAVLKTEGHRNREIAELRGCSERTVERQLNLIRKTWEKKTRNER